MATGKFGHPTTIETLSEDIRGYETLCARLQNERAELIERAEAAERRADELAAHVEVVRKELEKRGLLGEANLVMGDSEKLHASLSALRSKHWREAAGHLMANDDWANNRFGEAAMHIESQACAIERGDA